MIFIDAPYIMQNAYAETLQALANPSLLWAMTVVIAEQEKRFDPGEEFGALRRVRRIDQGSAAWSSYRSKAAAEA